MITEDKVTELFCMADDFCNFFDAMMENNTLKSVGYDTPFNLKDYALKQKEQSNTMHHYGWDGEEIKVLLMAQKKITDKGQAYKNFDQTSPGTAIVDASQKLGSKTLYQRIYEGVQYYEITDGKKTSYASDEPKEMEENPDI